MLQLEGSIVPLVATGVVLGGVRPLSLQNECHDCAAHKPHDVATALAWRTRFRHPGLAAGGPRALRCQAEHVFAVLGAERRRNVINAILINTVATALTLAARDGMIHSLGTDRTVLVEEVSRHAPCILLSTTR